MPACTARGLSKIAHSEGALARMGQPWNYLSRRTIGMTSRLSPANGRKCRVFFPIADTASRDGTGWLGM
jgi:hypothetical protein